MITTFMYHDIRDSKSYKKRYDLKSFLKIDEFKKHIDYIVKNYKVIKTKDIVNNINSDENLAIITFDDGLKDHYDIINILLEYKITGTFLIPTLPISDGKMIHSHKIQFILASEDESILKNRILKMIEGDKNEIYEKYSVTNVKDNWWSKDMIFITNFLRYGDKYKHITNFLFEEIVTKNEKNFCKDFYLNEEQVVEMINSDMEIGGHGYTSDILNDDNMFNEIDKSIDYIKKFHDNDIIFSYPNGVFNDKIVSYLSKKKCKFAYTTEKSVLNNNELLKIPRFDGPQTILI